jgi:hypothetical protein
MSTDPNHETFQAFIDLKETNLKEITGGFGGLEWYFEQIRDAEDN